MPLQPGTTLGPYEIQSQLGAGGMGEVYKARDTRLDRTVAIKVLLAQGADDPDLRQRFEREAKTISSLNHPHICTLYDIGQQDRIDYLVMEYLEGETLAQRLTKGALPLDQALRYAVEIADALDKAHRKGITHRDLKPGNIMLTKAGTKLLDFGLAKLRDPKTAGLNLSQRPTESASLTGEGKILGTLQYMAPEQLEGKEADHRTDIFAFGATVYEMATGKKAFEGESQASLIAAILDRDPVPVSTLQPMTPPALDRVIKKCLAKDSDARWHSAHDLHDELQWIADAGGQVGMPTSALAAPQRAGWRRALWATLAVVVAGLITGVVVWSVMRPAPSRLVRFTVSPDGNQGLRIGSASGDLAISPDGEHIVYLTRDTTGSGEQLQVRSLDQLTSATLVADGSPWTPFFSSDGEWVGFSDSTGPVLKRVSVQGGPALTICELPPGFLQGASWGGDDTIIFATMAEDSGLWRVAAVGGRPEQLTTPDHEQGEVDHRWPAILPGGHAVLFTILTRSTSSTGTLGVVQLPSGAAVDQGTLNMQIAVLDLETGEHKVISRGGSNPRYSPTGHVVFGVEGNLWAARFDLDRLETLGDPVPVLEGVLMKNSGAVGFSFSENGSLVYTPPVPGETERTLVWVDRQGREEPVGAPSRAYGWPRVSPDGTRLVVGIADPANIDVWVYDLTRATPRRLTFDDAADTDPLWTPNGERVVFRSDREGGGLFWRAADGTGPVERLTSSPHRQRPYAWARGGQLLVFHEDAASADLWVLSLEGEREPELLIQAPFDQRRAAVSPDGRWLAYMSNESGQEEVYVQPPPDLDGRWQISYDGGIAPVWRPDGRELFYRNGQAILRVAIDTEGPFALGNPEVLFEGQYLRGESGFGNNYDLAPDGQRFLMIKPATDETSTSGQIVVVQNWLAKLAQRVPVP